MVNKGRHSNGSQFYITLQAAPYLDKKYVAFGYVHFKFVYVIFIYVKMWFKNIWVSICTQPTNKLKTIKKTKNTNTIDKYIQK